MVVILDIWNYIESLRCTVADLTQRILKAQKNVEQIKFLINQWKDAPLFDRIDKERVEPLLNLTGINIIKVLSSLRLQGILLTFLLLKIIIKSLTFYLQTW